MIFAVHIFLITHNFLVSCFTVKRKIILFGGTFDPIHNGHTIVAADATRQIGAQKLLFIPARRSPHKQLLSHAGANDRIKMIKLAIAGMKKFSVSRCELDRPQPSYTLDTVRQFKARLGPDAQLYWLVGADTLDELRHWHAVEQLLDECNLSVMLRAGLPRPDFTSLLAILGQNRVENLQRNIIETPLIHISSTEIRKRLAAGDDVTDMLHPAVLAYIREKNLYPPKTPP